MNRARAAALISFVTIGSLQVSACTSILAGKAVKAPLAATASELLNPFDYDGIAPDVIVLRETTGDCQPSNISSGNTNARRCFTDESEVLDPCFVAPIGSSAVAVCISDPRSMEGIKVNVREDLGGGDSTTEDSQPWFVELEDGQGCGMIGGATGVLNGMRLNFGCPKGDLYGEPDRSGAVWMIHYQATGSSAVEDVSIRTVWF